jgi:FtsP/CotA-like multicopper oxidase with cupredoxin domain
MKSDATRAQIGAFGFVSMFALATGMIAPANWVNMTLSARDVGGLIMPPGGIMERTTKAEAMDDMSFAGPRKARRGSRGRPRICGSAAGMACARGLDLSRNAHGRDAAELFHHQRQSLSFDGNHPHEARRNALRFIGTNNGFVHPRHVHGGPFDVVARDGQTLSGAARFSADTINVAPGQRYDVIWRARKRRLADPLPHSSSHQQQ